MNKEAEDLTYEAGRAAKTAGYQRRLEEWTLQRNLAAGELVQFGQQIISSLIREQSARHEYNNHRVHNENAQAVTEFLQTKFAGQDLYGWMQGGAVYPRYDCYKFAVDTARKAEILAKNAWMRPELEAMNLLDSITGTAEKRIAGRRKTHLDLKRLEMAHYENNQREYELTKHISLLQLNPVALLQLKKPPGCANSRCPNGCTIWIVRDITCEELNL